MARDTDYSTRVITPRLLADIRDVLEGLQYGSIELYVTDGEVTQITKRQIKKTKNDILQKKN